MKFFLKSLFILLLLFLFWVLFVRFSYLTQEKRIYKQVEKEYLVLNQEFMPVLLYLKNYKKLNKIYPKNIPNNIFFHSRIFKKTEYLQSKNGTGYSLEIYPLKGPIKYYFTDEHDNGYNYYIGNGYYDGFLDNEYYYKIDKIFHAVTYDNF